MKYRKVGPNRYQVWEHPSGRLLGVVWHVTCYRNADFWRAATPDGRVAGLTSDRRRDAAYWLACQ